MPNYRFTTVDVFTDQRFGGNPLAVFTDANGMADGEMQSLATEFNLSETTFVLPPRDPTHTARVRIFNRTHEMPFAGHPTVGTAFALARMASGDAEIFEFEVLAGLVAVRIERDGDGILRGATIDAPQPLLLGPQISPESIAGCIGLDTSDIIVAAHPPVEASVGNTYVITEVSETALSRAVPDVSAFRRLLERSPALNGRFSLYLYSRDGNAIDARMFAPLVGTFEDPATGSAATPLAALLLSLSSKESEDFVVRQGVHMGRPSLMRVTAHRAQDVIRASVGGTCIPVLQGEAML
jgi:trans-2,3-dihydro-3-hydroxyanthranilate isomerase